MLSLPTLTKNQDHHITDRLTPPRGEFHFDTKSIPAFLENYALEDCLKCADLQIRVQVMLMRIFYRIYTYLGRFLRLTTPAGSKSPTYPSIMNISENSFTFYKNQNLTCSTVFVDVRIRACTISLPRRRSWRFVTRSCPEFSEAGTRDEPLRTSAWEANVQYAQLF